MRSRIAMALQLAGFVCFTTAGLTVSVGLGAAVAGLGMVLFGLAVERH